MPPKTGDANAARGRKMKEVAETVMPQPNSTPLPMAVPPVRYFPLHKQPNSPYYSNGAFRLDFNSDHSCPNSNPNPILLENLNISTPYKSFTSLLTGAGDQDSLPPSLREQNSKIDQIINFQGDHLKRTLADMQQRQYNVLVYEAEEIAAKKVKEKELELNQMAGKIVGLEHRESLLQKENQFLQHKLKHLEETTASLRAALQEAIQRGGKVECGGCSEPVGQQDDAESVRVDPSRVEPVQMACKVCGKQVSTVMMWPCLHICTCKSCDYKTNICPVCSSTKTNSLEVCLP